MAAGVAFQAASDSRPGPGAAGDPRAAGGEPVRRRQLRHPRPVQLGAGRGRQRGVARLPRPLPHASRRSQRASRSSSATRARRATWRARSTASAGRSARRAPPLLAQHYPHVTTLRDATCEMLDRHRDEMSPVVERRCRFIVEENERVLGAGPRADRGRPASPGARSSPSRTWARGTCTRSARRRWTQ